MREADAPYDGQIRNRASFFAGLTTVALASSCVVQVGGTPRTSMHVGPSRSVASTASSGIARAIGLQEPAKSQAGDLQVPPWRIGPVLVPGRGIGWFASAYAEVLEFDVDDGLDVPPGDVINKGKVDWTAAGVSAGITSSVGYAELLLGSVQLEDGDDDGAETDSGYSAAVRVGTNLFQESHIACGADLALGTAYADLDSLSAQGGDVSWLQADLRCAVSYVPSPGAIVAISPIAGIGLRVLDGYQDITTPDFHNPEFDAELFYGFAGLGLRWSPTLDFQCGVDLTLMLGELEGLSLSFLADF